MDKSLWIKPEVETVVQPRLGSCKSLYMLRFFARELKTFLASVDFSHNAQFLVSNLVSLWIIDVVSKEIKL